VHPSRVGDVEHHQHAMTVPGLSLSAEPSALYRFGSEALGGWLIDLPGDLDCRRRETLTDD